MADEIRQLAVNHHDDLPAFDPFDLARHANVLGDPAQYFLDLQSGVPLVVRHADGAPVFVVDDRGQLRPHAEYRAGAIAPHELPEVEATPNRFHFGRGRRRMRAGAEYAGAKTGFAFGATVTNPPAR
jgi:hypothetical protein